MAELSNMHTKHVIQEMSLTRSKLKGADEVDHSSIKGPRTSGRNAERFVFSHVEKWHPGSSLDILFFD